MGFLQSKPLEIKGFHGDPLFFENEYRAVLMRRNFDYITQNPKQQTKIQRQVDSQPALLKIDQKTIDSIDLTTESGKVDRIFLADAERTFSSFEFQAKLIDINSNLSKTFGDYQQNMSFIASFLLLTNDQNTTYSIVKKLHDCQKYLPGHFNARPIGAQTDICLFKRLFRENEQFNDIVKHLDKHSIPYDFLKKQFSGLNIHVLPFVALFSYFEEFFRQGFKFCLKYAFAFMTVLRQDILETDSASEIMNLLILADWQKKYNNQSKSLIQISKEIMKVALSEQFNDLIDNLNIEELRKEVYQSEVAAKIAEAEKYNLENPVEEIESCELCNDGFVDYICEQCDGLKLCEDCHEAAPNENGRDTKHLASHSVVDAVEEHLGIEDENVDLTTEKLASMSINKGEEKYTDEQLSKEFKAIKIEDVKQERIGKLEEN